MDFEYSTEQKLLRDSVGKLMRRLATPENLRRLDRERLYPYELYDAWVEAGVFALPFAEEYGGLGGSVLDLAIVAEEIGRYSADVAMAFGGSTFCALNVARKGSEEQKRYWLPKLISGEIRMSISMSEPDAGSDVGAMRTQARRDGNRYVISGQKIWATGAGAKNNFINVYVKTDPKAHYRQGMSRSSGRQHHANLDIHQLDMLGRRSGRHLRAQFQRRAHPPDRLIGGESHGSAFFPAYRRNAWSRPAIAAAHAACSTLRSVTPRIGGSSAAPSAHSRRLPTCSRTPRRKSKPPGR